METSENTQRQTEWYNALSGYFSPAPKPPTQSRRVVLANFSWSTYYAMIPVLRNPSPTGIISGAFGNGIEPYSRKSNDRNS